MDSAPNASAERSSLDVIQAQVALIGRDPVITTLMSAASGLLIVVNENREVVAVNDTFLRSLGVDGAEGVLGLRPGEALRCVHPPEAAGGCGTTAACATCGAAIAMAATLETGKVVDRKCFMTIHGPEGTTDWCLRVRSSLLQSHGYRFVLLLLQDITAAQRWEEIERVFFHDVSNLLMALAARVELLANADASTVLEGTGKFRQLVERLSREVEIQKLLAREGSGTVTIRPERLKLSSVMRDLEMAVASHPAARGRVVTIAPPATDSTFATDSSLSLRILSNMVVNALEASEPGDEIRVWTDQSSESIGIHVWNRQVIPAPVAARIFERHFSTKGESGRGLGTYAMKLFGEKVLGGRVSFTTSAPGGTVFSLSLPT
ncbi:MAG TPA: ATP-binding protein [Vicinamibacterales bacterium]|jgi:signal transduction histidine kinase